MNCDEARQGLPFLLYGELSFDEEESLQTHLDSCVPCREALAKERLIHAALDERDLDPSPFLVRRCRQRLQEQVEAISAHRGQGWSAWLGHVFSAPMPKFVQPVGAAALVALGFFGAQVAPQSWRTGFVGAGMVDPNTARVRYVEPTENGRIQIVVDETRQRVISGKLDDEPIRRLLLSAARDPNDPGLRGESVEILKSQPEADDVRSTLAYTIQHDTNPGVRLKALEALKPYGGDPEVRKALAQVLLHDDNPGVRTQAIDLLTKNNREDQLVGVLQELMRKEQNTYVRDRCQKVLKEMKASVETY